MDVDVDVDDSNDFNDLLCALDDQHSHYANVPMALACSHFACNQCLNDYKEINGGDMIKCELCNKEYKIDFNAIRESEWIRITISKNSPKLIKEVYSKYENQLKDLKKKMDENEKYFDVDISFAKEEIELRYRNLKTQLDDMKEKMIKKLDFLQNEFKKKQDELKYDDYHKKLILLKRNLFEKRDLDKTMLFDIQFMLKKLQQTINSINDIPLKFDLTLSKQNFDDSIIGSIDYNFENILDEIENKEFKKIDLDYTPKGLCCITDNRLLVSDLTNKCLKLYDENFKLIKTIDKINNISISPYDITTDRSSRIYVSSGDSDMILALDINMNLVKRIGDEGNRDDQFDYPLGLDLLGDSLYVCDSNNERIQKFTKDLVFEKSYQLQFKPWMIKVINNYAMIRPNGEPYELLIYCLEPKMKIINKILNGNATIHKHGSLFYSFSRKNKSFKCYDVKGNLVKEIKTVFPEEINILDGDLFFEIFNKTVVISYATGKALVNNSMFDIKNL